MSHPHSHSSPTAAAASHSNHLNVSHAVAESKKRIRSQEQDTDVDNDAREANAKDGPNEVEATGTTQVASMSTTRTSQSNTERRKKKTKYDRGTSGEILVVNEAAAASSTTHSPARSSSSSSLPSSALRCDSDSLSLIFSLLTTNEFLSSMRVSKQWLHVSCQRTSWPRYDFASATSEFHRPDELNPPSAASSLQHRHIVLKKADFLSLLIASGLARQCTALSVPFELLSGLSFERVANPLKDLSLANFSHLTSLSYKRVDEITPYQFGINADSLSDSLRVLNIHSSSLFSAHRTEPIPFLSLRVLSLTNCVIPEESLLQLHQLEYFRMELASGCHRREFIRCLRYLSGRHSLRSIDVRTTTAQHLQSNPIWLMFSLPFISILSMIQRMSPQYRDPIQWAEGEAKAITAGGAAAEQEVANTPPSIVMRLTRLDWNHGLIDASQLNDILTTQTETLEHLSCTLSSGLTYKEMTDQSLTTFSKLKSLSFNGATSRRAVDLKLIRVCTQLCTLRLQLSSSHEYNLADLSTLVNLKDFSLQLVDSKVVGNVPKYRIDSWSALIAMQSLWRLTLNLNVDRDRTSPLDVLAATLAQLPFFVRLDLHLASGSHFVLTSAFLTSVAASSTWNVMHIETRANDSYDLCRSKIPKLSVALAQSHAMTRFRVFRHVLKPSVKPTSTQHRIEATREERKPPQARWVTCK